MINKQAISWPTPKNIAYRKFLSSMLEAEIKSFYCNRAEIGKLSVELTSLLHDTDYCDSEVIYEEEAEELLRIIKAA